MRLHVLGVPNTRTRLDYTSCAFTQKCLHFCKMMYSRGHIVYHYGVEGSNPLCTENVSVVSNDTYERIYGMYDPLEPRPIDLSNDCWREYTANAIDEIGKRKQMNDIILPFFGNGHKSVCSAHSDLITIEPGIGYNGSFADIRIYESYAWMHCQTADRDNPSWYHVVIPPFFDLNEFTMGPTYEERIKDPYFLFIGRICECKGVGIAMDVCKKIGVKLKLAGFMYEPYASMELPENVEYVGPADVGLRKELMAGALGVFMPSTYVEPFGYVQVESLLSGTPVIASDWGAFTEVLCNGITGYRCRTFDDFVNAALDCLEYKIDYKDCRKQGERYSFDNIAPRYEEFFGDVLNLYGRGGWYELNPKTEKRIRSFQ